MPPGDAGYSSKRALGTVPRTDGADAGGAGSHPRVDDNYVDGTLAILMAWAYFLWTACGLRPAQAATRTQLCPASRRRRTW